jgi:hypothetical protein
MECDEFKRKNTRPQAPTDRDFTQKPTRTPALIFSNPALVLWLCVKKTQRSVLLCQEAAWTSAMKTYHAAKIVHTRGSVIDIEHTRSINFLHLHAIVKPVEIIGAARPPLFTLTALISFSTSSPIIVNMQPQHLTDEKREVTIPIGGSSQLSITTAKIIIVHLTLDHDQRADFACPKDWRRRLQMQSTAASAVFVFKFKPDHSPASFVVVATTRSQGSFAHSPAVVWGVVFVVVATNRSQGLLSKILGSVSPRMKR